MKTCSLNLRYSLPDRIEAFTRGLNRVGFHVKHGIGPADLLVTWNRIGLADDVAKRMPTLVCENASWGNSFAGHQWYHIAKTYHNTRGMFPIFDSRRWDYLDIELMPWCSTVLHPETVVLMQRGIGSAPVTMPRGWTAKGRIRRHPGRDKHFIPLEQDLQKAGKVVTWGSGGAIKALMMGIPVEAHYPEWIGQQDNTDEDRLRMFRELACAQWTIDEIKRGDPFEMLCGF